MVRSAYLAYGAVERLAEERSGPARIRGVVGGYL